ncbi:MAG: FecR domain-containing protein [bacterium]|nr:FecR domain-containing protein [bacterium]
MSVLPFRPGWRRALPVVLLAMAFGAMALPALADETGDPSVARISLLDGAVSVTRADSGETVAAAVNAPLMAGDSVSTQSASRAEVQFDYATMLRLGSNAQVRLARLDPAEHVVQLAAGTVELSVLRATQAHPEIETPSVDVRAGQPGRYRITITRDGNTEITVRSGRAEVLWPRGAQPLLPGKTLLVQGPAENPQFQYLASVAYDDFERWNDRRDRDLARYQGYAYASDFAGSADLYQYGRWADVAGYGSVWVPSEAPGWAPYRDGRWVWEPYYGWTWVGDEPWGWAPYHYGRWFYQPAVGWCWYPGPLYLHRFWRPALVVFIGFGPGDVNLFLGFGNIGWVPLAPFEVFRPWWGPRYVVNRTTIINQTTNIYNVTNVRTAYRNINAPNGLTAVRARDFTAGRFNRYVSVQSADLSRGMAVRSVLPIVPTTENLRLSGRQSSPLTGRSTPPAHPFRMFTTPQRPVWFSQQRDAVRAAPVRVAPKAPETGEQRRGEGQPRASSRAVRSQ